jgi:twinkle protein
MIEHIEFTPDLALQLHNFITTDTFSGVPMKWPQCHKKVAIRDHELTIVTGVNGHGKSMFINQIMTDFMRSTSQPWFVYSGEITTNRFLYRTIRQLTKEEIPSVGRLQDGLAWLNNKLYLSKYGESISYRNISFWIDEYYTKYGCKYFIIDSFMKCGIREDDAAAQKDFLTLLCDSKNAYPIHIFLVAHARKPPIQRHDENASLEPPPMKEDIRGIGTITDLADNVWSVWRNKKKEFYPHNHMREPDVKLFVLKQRNYEWEGEISFKFTKEGCNYE